MTREEQAREEQAWEEQTRRIQIALQYIKRSLELDLHRTAQLPITGPQMYVLYYLNLHERCKLTQLADKFEVKPSAITVMIDRLEKPGYVRRVPDPEDRRSVLVEVTPAGKEVLVQAFRARSRVLATYLSRLDEAEIPEFVRLLEKFAAVPADVMERFRA